MDKDSFSFVAFFSDYSKVVIVSFKEFEFKSF
jgi:hypothetical protein